MAFEDGKKLKIFTGNANPALAKEICDYLGLPLGEAFVGRFNNGEVQIMILIEFLMWLIMCVLVCLNSMVIICWAKH